MRVVYVDGVRICAEWGSRGRALVRVCRIDDDATLYQLMLEDFGPLGGVGIVVETPTGHRKVTVEQLRRMPAEWWQPESAPKPRAADQDALDLWISLCPELGGSVIDVNLVSR